MSQIGASSTAVGRPAENTGFRSYGTNAQAGGRPDTALQVLLERWIAAGLPRGLGLFGLWLRRVRHRHELADLSETQLTDVGLHPSHVRREIGKPFWMA